MKHVPAKLRLVSFDRWLFLLSCMLFVISIVCLGLASSIASQRTSVPYEGVAVGKAIRNGSSETTVLKIESKGSQRPFIAPTGYHYLIITLRVKNTSEKPFTVTPTNDTYMKNADGKVSYLAQYGLAAPFHTGIILPGEATQGELSFLVKDSGTYKFYTEGIWTSTAIPFMVQSKKQ